MSSQCLHASLMEISWESRSMWQFTVNVYILNLCKNDKKKPLKLNKRQFFASCMSSTPKSSKEHGLAILVSILIRSPKIMVWSCGKLHKNFGQLLQVLKLCPCPYFWYLLSKQFEPKSIRSLSSAIVQVSVVLKRSVGDSDWQFDNVCRSHKVTLTLKMTSAEVVEMSVTAVTNSSFQNDSHPHDHTKQTDIFLRGSGTNF